MAVSEALRRLAGVLDGYDEGRVTGVELAEGGDAERAVRAELELPLSTTPGDGDRTVLALSDATFDGDGTLQVELESIAPATADDVTVEPRGVTIDGDGQPTATLVASVPVDPGAAAVAETDVDGDGAVLEPDGDGANVGFDGVGDVHPDGNDADANVDPGDDGARDDGSAGGDDGAQGDGGIAGSSSGRIDARRERDVPPFRDPELLAEVYESCDTFAEMTDELGMDVTAETVRRYMIDYDIHQPNSYETGDDADGAAGGETGNSEGGGGEAVGSEAGEAVGSDAADDGGDGSEVGDGEAREEGSHAPATEAGEDGDSPVVLPDGIGLPDDVTVDSFIETVKRSNTIYEVKRDVGIDQDDALSMLQELNLLDLVVGRLATEAERDIRREEIVERLREASASQ